jgi:hypothetical protein
MKIYTTFKNQVPTPQIVKTIKNETGIVVPKNRE